MESRNRWFIAAVCVSVVAALAGFAYFGWLESQTSCTNPGCNIPEQVTLVTSWVNSPTNITLELFHSGQYSITLSSYTIRDGAGNIYSAPGWISSGFPANTKMNVTLTMDGKNLTFQSGNSYQVTMRTSQGYLFTFTVTT